MLDVLSNIVCRDGKDIGITRSFENVNQKPVRVLSNG